MRGLLLKGTKKGPVSLSVLRKLKMPLGGTTPRENHHHGLGGTACRECRSRTIKKWGCSLSTTAFNTLLSSPEGNDLSANQDARQITADLLRATGDAIAPADEDRALEDRINEVLVGD